MDRNVRRALLRRIAEASLGGADALAAHLGVSAAEFARWLDGEAHIPDGIFLRAVDIYSITRSAGRAPAARDARTRARGPSEGEN